MKRLIATIALFVLGGLMMASSPAPATAQMTAVATPIGCRALNIEHYISVNIRGIFLSGSQGTFLYLPDDLATVPNGGVLKPGKAFVMTDVRITYSDGTPGEFELVEADQGGTFDRVLLSEDSMLDGWQSSVGVIARGDRAPGMGVMVRALSGTASFSVDVEIVGYVRNI